MGDTYDVVVLGTGAAGLSAALTASVLDASVALFERAPTVGGTTAVSGGLAWVPAHNRPDVTEPMGIDDALAYLRALSNRTMDTELVEVYANSAASVIEFIEANSPVRYLLAAGFPDYQPELPGGRPQGGRSFVPAPFDFTALGEWANRVTAFPQDWSEVGFDAETRARWGRSFAEPGQTTDADIHVAGSALVGGLLRALLERGVEPQTRCRGIELLSDGRAVTGVMIDEPRGRREIWTRRGVIIACGGFEWDRDLVNAFLRGPMNGPVSPPNNTGDGLRMAMKAGAMLGNMGEAWWVPVVKIPGDVYGGHERSRSVRLERTRPRSIMVNRYGRRFANEAADYNSLGGPFHYLDATRFEYPNIPAWIVFDHTHLASYGFCGITASGPIPAWFHESGDLAELADRTRIDPDGLRATVASWNQHVAEGRDPDFGRGVSSYDGWWGDTSAPTLIGRTLGSIDTSPFYAVQVDIGCMGTKGGPRTNSHGQVLHVNGYPIPGLYAAGNAMAAALGMAYAGAGGTIGPALVWGHRAAAHAAARVDAS